VDDTSMTVQRNEVASL